MCWHTLTGFQVSALYENLLGLLEEMKSLRINCWTQGEQAYSSRGKKNKEKGDLDP